MSATMTLEERLARISAWQERQRAAVAAQAACRLHGEGPNPPDPTTCPPCERAQATLDAIQAAAEREQRAARRSEDLLEALEAACDRLTVLGFEPEVADWRSLIEYVKWGRA